MPTASDGDFVNLCIDDGLWVCEGDQGFLMAFWIAFIVFGFVKELPK